MYEIKLKVQWQQVTQDVKAKALGIGSIGKSAGAKKMGGEKK